MGPTVRMLPPPRPLSRLLSTMLPPAVLLPSRLQPQFMRSPSQPPFLLLLLMLFLLLDIHMESTPSTFWELTPVMLLVCHMPPTLPPTHMLVCQSLPLPQLPNLLKNQSQKQRIKIICSEKNPLIVRGILNSSKNKKN